MKNDVLELLRDPTSKGDLQIIFDQRLNLFFNEIPKISLNVNRP